MGDPPASALRDPLGPRIESFRPMPANVVAGGILCAMLFAAGLGIAGVMVHAVVTAGGRLPFHAEKGWGWAVVGLGVVSSVALIALGLALASGVHVLWSHEVDVHENGLRGGCDRAAYELPWTAMASIHEVVHYERPPVGLLMVLLPRTPSWSYRVLTTWGEVFDFNGNAINRIRRFGNILRERSAHAGVPWATVEVND